MKCMSTTWAWLLQQLLVAIVAVLVLGSHCYASRSSSRSFKLMIPKSQQYYHSGAGVGHFFNYMPKRRIPVSGPSRKHNDLGLQTWRLP